MADDARRRGRRRSPSPDASSARGGDRVPPKSRRRSSQSRSPEAPRDKRDASPDHAHSRRRRKDASSAENSEDDARAKRKRRDRGASSKDGSKEYKPERAADSRRSKPSSSIATSKTGSSKWDNAPEAGAPDAVDAQPPAGVDAQALAKQQRHAELYVGNLQPGTSYETLAGFLAGLLAALGEALPGNADAALLARGGTAIVRGRAQGPTGLDDQRTRTDHAFLECRSAQVSSTLLLFSEGLAAGGKGLRISRPKGYVAPAGGDRAIVQVPLEVLSALGVEADAFTSEAPSASDQQALLAQLQQQQRSNAPPPSYVCHRCGVGGHYVQDCPSVLLGAMTGPPPAGYACHKCGGGGHYVHECPQQTLTAAQSAPFAAAPSPTSRPDDAPRSSLHDADADERRAPRSSARSDRDEGADRGRRDDVTRRRDDESRRREDDLRRREDEASRRGEETRRRDDAQRGAPAAPDASGRQSGAKSLKLRRYEAAFKAGEITQEQFLAATRRAEADGDGGTRDKAASSARQDSASAAPAPRDAGPAAPGASVGRAVRVMVPSEELRDQLGIAQSWDAGTSRYAVLLPQRRRTVQLLASQIQVVDDAEIAAKVLADVARQQSGDDGDAEYDPTAAADEDDAPMQRGAAQSSRHGVPQSYNNSPPQQPAFGAAPPDMSQAMDLSGNMQPPSSFPNGPSPDQYGNAQPQMYGNAPPPMFNGMPGPPDMYGNAQPPDMYGNAQPPPMYGSGPPPQMYGAPPGPPDMYGNAQPPMDMYGNAQMYGNQPPMYGGPPPDMYGNQQQMYGGGMQQPMYDGRGPPPDMYGRGPPPDQYGRGQDYGRGPPQDYGHGPPQQQDDYDPRPTSRYPNGPPPPNRKRAYGKGPALPTAHELAFKQAQMGPVLPPPPGRFAGLCLWFDIEKNFGFITPDVGGENMFLHGLDIAIGPIKKGDSVHFTRGGDMQGRCKATRVCPAHAEGAMKTGPDERSGAVGAEDAALPPGTYRAPPPAYALQTAPAPQAPKAAEPLPPGFVPPPAKAKALPKYTRVRGQVKFFDYDKKFGFVSPHDGSEDVFVHALDVVTGQPLAKGDEIEYVKAWTPGTQRPKASTVTVISQQPSDHVHEHDGFQAPFPPEGVFAPPFPPDGTYPPGMPPPGMPPPGFQPDGTYPPGMPPPPGMYPYPPPMY